jgi:hypothetical protein
MFHLLWTYNIIGNVGFESLILSVVENADRCYIGSNPIVSTNLKKLLT